MAQRTLLGLVLGLATAAPALAQWPGASKPAGLGLHPAPAAFKIPCGSLAFPCDEAPSLRLYTAPSFARSLDLQVASLGLAAQRRYAEPGPQGLHLSFLGRASLASDLAVYGRLGTALGRLQPVLPGPGESVSGLGWGVGVSWDFSPRGSAVLGWDSWDLRSGGEPVRSTSLGLQWRY